MGPKTFTAPKVWKRPYTAIYNDNYRYGNSLYSGAVAEIENRSKGYSPYFSSPNAASYIADPGVRRAILEAELLTSSDILPANLMESMVAAAESSVKNASSMSSANASSSMKEYQSIIETTTTTSTSGRRGSDSFNTYTSAKDLANLESGLDDLRIRRRKQLAARPTTTIYRSTSPLGGTFYHSTDQGNMSADSILDGSYKDWSLERYYARAVRNAHAPRPTAFLMQ